jgi:hypothetical protein
MNKCCIDLDVGVVCSHKTPRNLSLWQRMVIGSNPVPGTNYHNLVDEFLGADWEVGQGAPT